MASSLSSTTESESPAAVLLQAQEVKVGEQYDVVCAIVRHLPIESLKDAARVSKLWASAVFHLRYSLRLSKELIINDMPSNLSVEKCGVGLSLSLSNTVDAWVKPFTYKRTVAYHAYRMSTAGGSCGCLVRIFGDDNPFDREKLKGILVFTDNEVLDNGFVAYLLKKAAGRADAFDHVSLAGLVIDSVRIEDPKSSGHVKTDEPNIPCEWDSDSSDEEGDSVKKFKELDHCFISGLLFGGSGIEIATTALFVGEMVEDYAPMKKKLKRVPMLGSLGDVFFSYPPEKLATADSLGESGRLGQMNSEEEPVLVVMFISIRRLSVLKMASSDSSGSDGEQLSLVLVMENQKPKVGEQYDVVCTIVRHLPIESLKNAARVSKLWASVVSRERLKSALDIFIWDETDFPECIQKSVLAKPEVVIVFMLTYEAVVCSAFDVIAYSPRRKFKGRLSDLKFQKRVAGLSISLSNTQDAWVKHFGFNSATAEHAQRVSQCGQYCSCLEKLFGDSDRVDRKKLKAILLFTDNKRLDDSMIAYLLRMAAGREDATEYVTLAGTVINSVCLKDLKPSGQGGAEGATGFGKCKSEANGKTGDPSNQLRNFRSSFIAGLMFGGSGVEVTTALFPGEQLGDVSMITEFKRIRSQLPPKSSHDTVAFIFYCPEHLLLIIDPLPYFTSLFPEII
ncbi:unnamed protein product [Cyprideis torosa]|uniref:Uncharacterized protein n=1 Tax=Cyprideis torosa TaxID=163714 RepID=A0A7R8WBV3_9CRUS|nr:unnamed protein product [Cyprideis torosa]CAG0892508.1 unnamed protein product [Cyprideis torosa]